MDIVNSINTHLRFILKSHTKQIFNFLKLHSPNQICFLYCIIILCFYPLLLSSSLFVVIALCQEVIVIVFLKRQEEATINSYYNSFKSNTEKKSLTIFLHIGCTKNIFANCKQIITWYKSCYKSHKQWTTKLYKFI